MSTGNLRITLDATTEQEVAIRELYAQRGWNYSPDIQGLNVETHSVHDVHAVPQMAGASLRPSIMPCLPDSEGIECPHCYCTPCITDVQWRQLWWPSQKPPHAKNSAGRKKMYKKFWGQMSSIGLWDHPGYIDRKNLALQRDPHHSNYTWVTFVKRREIMPNCVLKFVRGHLPSPNM